MEQSQSEQSPSTEEEGDAAAASRDTAAKLAALARAPWKVRPNYRRPEHRPQGIYYLRPYPLRTGLRYQLEPGSDEMLVLDMDLDDPSLERRGIGSLLLIKAARVVLKHRNPNLATVVRGQGNGALVGALEKAFGEENVSYRVPEDRPDDSDVVCDIQADVDPDRILGVNFAERLGQLAATGYVQESVR